MRNIALLSTSVLLATALSGCSDPFTNAAVSLRITGSPEIIGEQVMISVDVQGVSAEKVLVIQEKLDGGDWVDLQSFILSGSDTSASLDDEVNDVGALHYRALVLPSAGAEPRAEAISEPFSPISLEEYVDSNLGMELSIADKPDQSEYFFVGDQIGIEVAINISAPGLQTSFALTYQATGTTVLADRLSAGVSRIDWEVESGKEVETGDLVLSAVITGRAETVTRSQNFPVVVANPVQAFATLSELANATSSSTDRRALLLAAAGDLFIDQSSKSWTDGLNVNFLFDEPFLGELRNLEPAMRYGVPQGCAPGGEVDTAQLPGRPFLIEAELAGYDFDETIFGYFDGEEVLFSAAWKFCLG